LGRTLAPARESGLTRESLLLKSDRIGLVIVVASLAAIAVIAWLVFQNQQADRVLDIRSQGVSLARAVSGIPYDELVPGGQQQGLVQVLRHSAGNNDLAYVVLVFRDETQEALACQARADFVAHLSHELKSPLNVLGMYSESLLSEVGKTEKFRIEAANVIAEEVSRLSSLISGLLSMTQIENGSLTPERSLVKLNDVAAAAFEEAEHMAVGKKQIFVFNVPKDMNPVFVDKDLIRIAITNLLSNAVKYNRDDGEVQLAIEETEDAIQIRVADSGIGISEVEETNIFDKFYRSEDERVQAVSGHGLGLALAKQIVELHHGTLSVNRDRDEGTEFIINLWKETTAIKQAI
jgi:signal transduction histidine kinase